MADMSAVHVDNRRAHGHSCLPVYGSNGSEWRVVYERHASAVLHRAAVRLSVGASYERTGLSTERGGEAAGRDDADNDAASEV